MSKPATSAKLIMKLYDLRREDTMREARNCFISFFPELADDVMRTMIDPKTSPLYRMVITYLDMAASLSITERSTKRCSLIRMANVL